MKVVVFKRETLKNIPEEVDELYSSDNFLKFFENVDYIVNTLPSTKQTKGLLSGKVLKSCKNSPVLINVGRGNVIDEKSILNSLENKWISKAILDVFEIEPLPKESLLWKHPDVIVTPHIAARTFAKDISKLFIENMERYMNEQELKYQVDFKRGY